jgi:dynein assembly factor 6, axonemal
MYRQRVGTEDVYLGMSGVDSSSNHCQEILYKIELPDTQTKDIQLDLNEKQMVVQSKRHYLIEHFQYPMNYKQAKAKFIADKGVLELILPIIRPDDF